MWPVILHRFSWKRVDVLEHGRVDALKHVPAADGVGDGEGIVDEAVAQWLDVDGLAVHGEPCGYVCVAHI